MIFCCELFDKVICSDKFNDFLSAYGIVVSSYHIDEGDYRVSFKYNDEEIYVSSKYSSFHNATVFSVGEEQRVWFIIEHYENKIHLFDVECTYEWYPEQYKMWEKFWSNGCVSKLLTENNIIYIEQHLDVKIREMIESLENEVVEVKESRSSYWFKDIGKYAFRKL